MGEGALRKNFNLTTGQQWDDDLAEIIDSMFEEIVSRHVSLKTGTYTGNGRIQSVPVKELPGNPKLLIIQPALGGTPYLTLVAYPAGKVTAWSQASFVVSDDAAVSSPGVRYRYFIVG